MERKHFMLDAVQMSAQCLNYLSCTLVMSAAMMSTSSSHTLRLHGVRHWSQVVITITITTCSDAPNEQLHEPLDGTGQARVEWYTAGVPHHGTAA
jgi:hypothetical protein